MNNVCPNAGCKKQHHIRVLCRCTQPNEAVVWYIYDVTDQLSRNDGQCYLLTELQHRVLLEASFSIVRLLSSVMENDPDRNVVSDQGPLGTVMFASDAAESQTMWKLIKIRTIVMGSILTRE